MVDATACPTHSDQSQCPRRRQRHRTAGQDDDRDRQTEDEFADGHLVFPAGPVTIDAITVTTAGSTGTEESRYSAILAVLSSVATRFNT